MNGKEGDMRTNYMMTVDDVMEELGVKRSKEAREKVEMLMEQMAEQWGVTEELKMQDQMEWVRRMNGIRSITEEITSDFRLILYFPIEYSDNYLNVVELMYE